MHEHEEYILSRLGSRFSLRFQPRARYLFASPLGVGFDRPLRLEISVLSNGTRIVWPFSPGRSFEHVSTRVSPSTLEFTCSSALLDIELVVKFTAPFFPQEEEISCAPFFYLDLTCRRTGEGAGCAAEMKAALFGREGEAVAREKGNVVLRGTYHLAHQDSTEQGDGFSRRQFPAATALIPLSGRMSLKETTFSIDCPPGGEPARASFVFAGHCDQPALSVEGLPQRLYYVRTFPSLAEVASFARNEEALIRRKAAFFDDVILSSSLDKFEKDFIACSFQSYLSSTWWTEREGGGDWFGCWNEDAVHNASAAEYGASLFYLNYWPELLKKQLAQRAEWAQKLSAHSSDNGNGEMAPVVSASADEAVRAEPAVETQEEGSAEQSLLASTCGRFLSVAPSIAQAAGERDLCNYLLLLFSYWRWNNDFQLIQEHFPLIRTIATFLASRCSEGPAPSDDPAGGAEAALRLACALDAAAIMAEEAGDEDLAQALSLSEAELGRSMEARPQVAFSADSLLHHVMCDCLPEFSQSLIERLCSSSAASSLRNSPAASDILLDDITAAYFGLNVLQSQRYRDALAQGSKISLLSVPSSCESGGAQALGIIQGLLGVRLDRVEGRLSLSPLCAPARLPLIPLIDWEAHRVPWVEIWCEGALMKTGVHGADEIKKVFDFAVDPHRRLRHEKQ